MGGVCVMYIDAFMVFSCLYALDLGFSSLCHILPTHIFMAIILS